MNDFQLFEDFVPTCDAEVDIGQVVFDATTKTDYKITALTGRTILVDDFSYPIEGPKAMKKANLHWVGTHWVHLPRPWILTVEEWDGKTFIAQFHDTQAEMMVEGDPSLLSPEKGVIMKFPNQGQVTLFKLRRMIIRLDAVALVNGLKSDLGENGPFGSTLDLVMSQATLRETLSPTIKNTLIDELEKAWDRAAPEGVWWAIGGHGETWCSGCAKQLFGCFCGDSA